MNANSTKQQSPFGERSHEQDFKRLGNQWEEYYFHDLPFAEQIRDQNSYLLVGRRGVGKTSLAAHLSNESHWKSAVTVTGEASVELYEQVWEASKRLKAYDSISIPKLATLWKSLFWGLAFNNFRNQGGIIASAADLTGPENGDSAVSISAQIFHSLVEQYTGLASEGLISRVSELWHSDTIQDAKREVLAITMSSPLILVIDSIDKVKITDRPLMRCLASLIEAASDFNDDHSADGFHVKVIVPGEIYTDLKEGVILNPAKTVRDPVFLNWTPQHLLRMICWRFFHYLKSNNMLANISKGHIDWRDHRDVLRKIWSPYFGEQVENNMGRAENSFLYVLRHTQLRPRQLIMICNGIAKRASESADFPYFKREHILKGVQHEEIYLAEEVMNVYTDVLQIDTRQLFDILIGCQKTISPSVLAKRQKQDFVTDPRLRQSGPEIRRLLARMGVVGAIRKVDAKLGIIEADFEYGMENRLDPPNDKLLAIHPMFFEKLAVPRRDRDADPNPPSITYPFPEDPELRELIYACADKSACEWK